MDKTTTMHPQIQSGNSKEILELISKLSYSEYRACISLFQGTGNSEGNLKEKPLADALRTSKTHSFLGVQFKVPIEGLKRKCHRVDILLESETEVVAVNSKSNGKSHTFSDDHVISDYSSYVNGLKKLFPNKKISYVLARNSNVKHGLLPEVSSLGVSELSWEELFELLEVSANPEELKKVTELEILSKLKKNALRWFAA